MIDLHNKVILVTGGARGIGGETAKLCAQSGATVIIADIEREQAATTVQEISAVGGVVQFIMTDMRKDEQIKSLFNSIQESYGRLDGMVCAAGVLLGAYQTPEELPLEVFEMVVDINVKGVFLCAKYATPLLEAAKGVMILVASGAGVTGSSSSLAYGTSKGGVNGLGLVLADHLGKRNIRVNTLCPGNIVTEMKLSVDIAGAKKKGIPEEEAIQKAEREYGRPDGVAKIITFLLSDDADYLRGSIFTR